MFAPSSSDDDGASRDDCSAHLETLTRLACRAQTLVADLLHAADAQDVTFQLDRHPERVDALFDFEYLRRPSACDARLSATPALRRADETCRAACQSRVWRAYRSFANVVRWRDAFVAFCESLRERDVAGESSSEDAGRADRSYDSDTRHDVTDDDTDDTDDGSFANAETPRTSPRPRRRSARRNDDENEKETKPPHASSRTPSFRAASRDFAFREATRELVSVFASALLIIQTRFDVSFLERVVVQRARWRWSNVERQTSSNVERQERVKSSSVHAATRAEDPPEWDAVVALCRSVSASAIGTYGRKDTQHTKDTKDTKDTRHTTSFGSTQNVLRGVPGAGAFARFGLPAFIAELALESCADDLARSRRELGPGRGFGITRKQKDGTVCPSEDDARGAREACLCLFFAPETLQRDHGFMRDVVDAHFARAFVVHAGPPGGGLIVDLATVWFPFEAARRALADARALCVARWSDSPSEAEVARAGSSWTAAALPDALNPEDAAAAHLVSEHAASLRDAAADVSARLSRWSAAANAYTFGDAEPETPTFKKNVAALVSAEFEPSLASLRAANAAAAWLFAHAHAEDGAFRGAFAKHAPAPESAVDALLDVAELERVLGEALASALRAKNETWTRAVARAAANAEALAALSRDDGGDDDDAETSTTTRPAPGESTPTKRVINRTGVPKTSPKTPKTPARVGARARYAKIRARLDALPASVSPALDSSTVAREVASIARALERVEEEEASKAASTVKRARDGRDDADDESRFARARAHAGALFACLATARQAASLHAGQSRALEATREGRFRGAGTGCVDRGVLDEHVPYLRSRLAADPGLSAKKIVALVAKLARAAERRTLRPFDLLLRAESERSERSESHLLRGISRRRVSAYYARDVTAFAEDVLRAAPEKALDALDACLFSFRDFEDSEVYDANAIARSRSARLALAAASAKAAALADSLLRVPRVRVFAAWLDPRAVLAGGLRRALRRRVASATREAARRFDVLETGVFGGASARDATPAEFTATLELCRGRIARHAAAFEMAAEYFCAGGTQSDARCVAAVAEEETRDAVREGRATRESQEGGSSSFDEDMGSDDDDARDGRSLFRDLASDDDDLASDDGASDDFRRSRFLERNLEIAADETRTSFVGASVRELLRQTDPRRARFLDARSGYVAIPAAAFGPLTGVFSHDIATTKQLGPATFDCLADILGAAGVRVARARLAARAEDATASTLAFYGDKMAGAAAAVVARVVAAAGPYRSYPLASSVHDANDAADTAIAEASRVFAEASFFAEMREGCVDAGHASLASRVLASSTAARRREFARGARRAREAAATLFRVKTDVASDVSGVSRHGRITSSREDVDQWSTLLFLFTLSALPSYARDSQSGKLVPRRDVARSDAPDAAALVVGVLSVLHRLDANATNPGLGPDGAPQGGDFEETSFAGGTFRPDGRSSRTDFDRSGFDPVSDEEDETEQKKEVGPFVSAYLGCLARHLRRFASRRGASAARGVGAAPSSIAGAFSAALETAKHAMESGAGKSTSAFGAGVGAAAAESSACAEWLETACRLGTIPRRALYAHAPPYVLDNASTRWEE